MKRNKVNNQLDHPRDYYYFNVSCLRKCLWGNIWKCNNLILNIMKTKQITVYCRDWEHGQRQLLVREVCFRRPGSFCCAAVCPQKKAVLKLAMMACGSLFYRWKALSNVKIPRIGHALFVSTLPSILEVWTLILGCVMLNMSMSIIC